MKLRKCFEFTGEEYFFQGHFPEMPIMPGVIQLKLANEAVQATMNRELVLKEVKKLKFLSVIEPRTKVTLELEGDKEINFRFLKGDKVCSQGVLVY